MFIFSLGFSQILNPNLIESVLDVLVGRYFHFYHVPYNLQEFQSFPVDCIWPLSFQDELTLPHEIAAESTYHPQFWGDSIVVYDIVRVIILVKRYLDKLLDYEPCDRETFGVLVSLTWPINLQRAWSALLVE